MCLLILLTLMQLLQEIIDQAHVRIYGRAGEIMSRVMVRVKERMEAIS